MDYFNKSPEVFFCCAKCGSTQVATRDWVNPNTGSRVFRPEAWSGPHRKTQDVALVDGTIFRDASVVSEPGVCLNTGESGYLGVGEPSSVCPSAASHRVPILMVKRADLIYIQELSREHEVRENTRQIEEDFEYYKVHFGPP